MEKIMRILTSTSTVATVALLISLPAVAQSPTRVRGTVTAVDDGRITVKDYTGSAITLNTGGKTSYAYVVPSSLDDIKTNDFIGAAVKGPSSALVAVEVALIPEDMRAGRIAFYAWDPLPDPTATKSSDATVTGNVSNALGQTARLADTNMTNGLVAAVRSGGAGRRLTVTYDHGRKSLSIAVPRRAPVVRYVLADRSALAVGSAVFIKINPGNEADLVTIGKGVTPPM
jgi:hypothetical protein